MGTFSELKCHYQNCAEKLMKFKQAVMIDCMGGIVEASHFKNGVDGVCSALTMRWLAEQLGAVVDGGGARFGKGQGDARLMNDLEIARTAMSRFTYTKQVNAMLGKGESLRALGRTVGLRFHYDERSKGSADVCSTLGDLDTQKFLGGSNAYYLAVVFKKGNGSFGGHAVGIVLKEGDCYFFDPNVGEYRVTNMDKFASIWAKCYTEGLGLEPYWMFDYTVER